MALTSQMPLEERLTIPENLYWAWLKFLRHLKYGDFWYDEAEVARFEANLKFELEDIAKQFSKLKYNNSPLRPLPHPKSSDNNKHQNVRQAFWVPVRDQVAWIAFVNVIGPWLDYKMPPWSYGNRLYRSVWIEERDNRPVVRIGWYRHTSGYIYRKFRQSWPLFRRHIFLTAKAMTGTLFKEELDEPERRVLEAEDDFPDRHKLPYLKRAFWPKNSNNDLYWASIDLEKFYPSISLSCVKRNLSTFSDYFKNEIDCLASQLLTFPLDLSGFDDEELSLMDLSKKSKRLNCIPTGLTVAGFLANVALLEVDNMAKKEIERIKAQPNRGIAHFRYVDDHVILSRRFEDLIRWIKRYEEILVDCQTCARFNYAKIKPIELAEYLQMNEPIDENGDSKGFSVQKKIKEICELDPRYPSPLMTKTLWLVSNLAMKEFDLLDIEEQKHFLNELEHLLLAEFPDEEIREDTRVSFAATMLSRFAPRQIEGSIAKYCQIERNLVEEELQVKNYEEKIEFLQRTSRKRLDIIKKIESIKKRTDILEKDKKAIESAIQVEVNRNRKRIFYLLLKAVNEHPEKPRLWIRLLQYCQYSGYDKLDPFNGELNRLDEQAPLTTPYLRAFLQQVMARQAVQCAVAISKKDHPIYRREAALMYLRALLNFQIKNMAHFSQRYFENASRSLLQCGLGTAVHFLKCSESKEFLKKNDFNKIETLARECGAIIWDHLPEKWASMQHYPLSVWAWWAESRTTPKSRIEPGPIWNSVARELRSNDPYAWALWGLYPRFLFDKVGPEPFQELTSSNKAYFEKINEGWLYEIFSSADQTCYPQFFRKDKAKSIYRVFSVLKDSKRRLTGLDKWVEWSKNKYKKNPFDPRVSEWTALEIIDQITSQLRSANFFGHNGYFPIHPANFSLPTHWKDDKNDVLTWENWRSEIEAEKSKIKIRHKKLIHDFRYTPILNLQFALDIEWVPLRGLAMCLLGLITRSLDWPATWNIIGHERANEILVRSRMNEAPFSSWSAAILEACLLPRPRETNLLETSLQEKLSDDTTFDPPRIRNLRHFQTCLKKAKSVLKSYQLSVQSHMPRQLIPVKMRQLTRPNWVEDFGDDTID